ncbi:DsbA family protein [Phreatobacter sp. AB_2022a]|uniref:DsbA family protein n=1 Tax=Phreatobacter sp. AB_2022a TaxID=3003134 RepID=UPI002286ECD8|nr:DsbA family protein [Phreatobacter sp. AB_2022a]MCZ0736446.1 DsbA family protein [Phreatobacter sp. AB_2022a]
MSDPITVTYLFDPLCGWCYGASPVIRQLARAPGIAVVPAPTGLFSGAGARPMDADFAAYAWSNDQRIAQLTGQPFSEAYRLKVLNAPGQRFDSTAATAGLAAVHLSRPEAELDALAALQSARYDGGRDIVSAAGVATILREAGLAEAADRLAAAAPALVDAVRQRTGAAQRMMAAFGARGVPALVAGTGGNQRLLGSNALFGDARALIAAIGAS